MTTATTPPSIIGTASSPAPLPAALAATVAALVAAAAADFVDFFAADVMLGVLPVVVDVIEFMLLLAFEDMLVIADEAELPLMLLAAVAIEEGEGVPEAAVSEAEVAAPVTDATVLSLSMTK